ncbi:hypothetical protein K438DRAFT_1969385 [Mycena galopus ATCC 62051]|nr:hypothetical protein K438DRAFT_1969385 [Mycena galopus ATCC 62051]
MEPEDAKDLLLQLAFQGRSDKQEKLSSNEREKLGVAIVKELHYFALAVSQAGGYIHARGKLSGYLKLYQSHRDQLLQRAEIQGQSQYGLAVYATWNLSYERLSSSGRTMLQICSSLHHEGIFEQIFEKAAVSQKELDDSELQVEVTRLLTELGKQDVTWDSFVFESVMGELESYSLIERDRQDDSYRIHPLVQHWSGTTIETNTYHMQKCVLAMIGLSISWSRGDVDYKYRRKLLQHVIRSIDSLNQEEICALVAARIALVFYEGGHWKDAEVLNVVVMERRKRVLGEEHPDTLTSMGNLASTYWSQGRWKDAEALQVVVMEMRKCVLGEEHPDTLTSMNDLASTYWNQGRWKDAEALDVVVMEMRKCVLGEEHPYTLTSMANLACTYRDQGRWKDAEALEVVVMGMRKRVLGEEHPDTLTSMANLASTYGNQGRWKDAEALKVVVMEMRKRVLGEEHPDTLRSMANLACTYGDQCRWKEAEALEVVVMEMRKHVLGEEHPDTLMSMANLACTYGNQGLWMDAEALQVVVMEMRKRVLGEEHPNTLTSMGNLACTYVDQGRWKDAEVLEVAVMEKRKRVLGENHPHTLTSMANLADTYKTQGRWKDAEALEVVMSLSGEPFVWPFVRPPVRLWIVRTVRLWIVRLPIVRTVRLPIVRTVRLRIVRTVRPPIVRNLLLHLTPPHQRPEPRPPSLQPPLRPSPVARIGMCYATRPGIIANPFGHHGNPHSFFSSDSPAGRKDLRDKLVKIGKFGVDSDSNHYTSAPASPTSNLDPSSPILMDAPSTGNTAAQSRLLDVHILDTASDPETQLIAVEESLANIEVMLLCLLHSSQKPPANAPVPAVLAPAAGPNFTTLTPAAKLVLQPNPPAIFDSDWTQGQMFLYSVLTYLRLVPEAFMTNGQVVEEKLVCYAISFMARDTAGRWAEQQSTIVPFPFPSWAEFETKFRLWFIEENEQDQALLHLESHGYYQGSRYVYRYTDDFEELAATAGYTDPSSVSPSTGQGWICGLTPRSQRPGPLWLSSTTLDGASTPSSHNGYGH